MQKAAPADPGDAAAFVNGDVKTSKRTYVNTSKRKSVKASKSKDALTSNDGAPKRRYTVWLPLELGHKMEVWCTHVRMPPDNRRPHDATIARAMEEALTAWLPGEEKRIGVKFSRR